MYPDWKEEIVISYEVPLEEVPYEDWLPVFIRILHS